MYRADERALLSASGPALLEAVLGRVKAAEERLAATRFNSLLCTHFLQTSSVMLQQFVETPTDHASCLHAQLVVY